MSMNGRLVLGKRVDVLGYHDVVAKLVGWALVGDSRYVCLANVHMLMEAHKDPEFSSLLEGADLVAPDGMPLVVALRLLHGVRQERVAGMDLLPSLLAQAALHSIPVFFYGSTAQVLERVVDRCRSDHPDLLIAGWHSPPFRELSPVEMAADAERINRSQAGIVFAALGCPKQETWMAGNRGRIGAVMVGVGGALPVYAGLQARAPFWMQRCSLEWLYRLCQEPRRLLRRYLITNSHFLALFSRELLRGAISGGTCPPQRNKAWWVTRVRQGVAVSPCHRHVFPERSKMKDCLRK